MSSERAYPRTACAVQSRHTFWGGEHARSEGIRNTSGEKEAAHRSGVHSHRPESAIASLPPELPSVNALLYTGESLAPLKSLSKAFLK